MLSLFSYVHSQTNDSINTVQWLFWELDNNSMITIWALRNRSLYSIEKHTKGFQIQFIFIIFWLLINQEALYVWVCYLINNMLQTKHFTLVIEIWFINEQSVTICVQSLNVSITLWRTTKVVFTILRQMYHNLSSFPCLLTLNSNIYYSLDWKWFYWQTFFQILYHFIECDGKSPRALLVWNKKNKNTKPYT